MQHTWDLDRTQQNQWEFEVTFRQQGSILDGEGRGGINECLLLPHDTPRLFL